LSLHLIARPAPGPNALPDFDLQTQGTGLVACPTWRFRSKILR